MVKCHEVAGLGLYPPAALVIFLRWSRNQPEDRIEAFHLERADLNPPELDRAKIRDAAFKHPLRCTLVESFSRSYIINPGFQEPAVRIEQVHSHKLTAGMTGASGDKGRRCEKLAPIGCATNVAGVVVVMLDRDEVGGVMFSVAHPGRLTDRA